MPTSVDRADNRSLAMIPDFVPHRLIRGGHAQTIMGRYLPGRGPRYTSTYHEVDVGGGDRVSVLDSLPANWTRGGPAAILIHGLSGCARSPYVVRVAGKLVRLGVRAVRMNLRGAGSGFGLARGIYHGGRTEDLRKVAEWLAQRAPGSPIALIGFSLGANIVLKLAAEAVEHPLAGLDSVLAANPPIDLAACARRIQDPANRVYDRNFVRNLRKDIQKLHATFPDLGPIDLSQVASVFDFDELYTAPRNGFDGASDYYAKCSSGPLIPRIRVPGLVVHAVDDPFIPPEPFGAVHFPPRLALELISSGGHLGYVSRTRWDGDHRWLDTRLAAWLAQHWAANLGPATARTVIGGPDHP